MKQEIKDIAQQAIVGAPTSGYAIFTGITVAEWIAIGLGVLQAAYLIRKWVREETEWGVKLRRKFRAVTTPAGLDELDGSP